MSIEDEDSEDSSNAVPEDEAYALHTTDAYPKASSEDLMES